MDLATAELTLTASAMLGLPYDLQALETILKALKNARGGGGSIKQDGSDLILEAKLDPETRRKVDLRRLRMVASKAATETFYYHELFTKIGLDPTRLTWEDLPNIPITPKEHLRDRPGDFVCKSADVAFRTTTHCTTGQPTNVCFSQREMKYYAYLCAIFNAMIGDFCPDDIVLGVQASRGLLANMTGMECTAMLDSTQMNIGQVDPSEILDLLVEEHQLPGKRPKVSILIAYPSYLGKLITEALKRGLSPKDFGLRRIDLGGEIATEGLKRRAQKLFGPIGFYEGYGSTETWGTGGDYCSQGHMHFGGGGIWEFLDPDSYQPAGNGQVATLVCTVLPPIRETTLVIRYDTQDMVRRIGSPLECESASTAASSPIMGKRKHSVHHPDGSWTFPRQVMEALDCLEVVPLPARFGFWGMEGGVAVDVVALDKGKETQRAIESSLQAQGIALKELTLLTDQEEVRNPFPLRGDLIERSFGMPK